MEMSEVTVTVSGRVGSGKSAICGEIEILCKALGLQVEWCGGQQEKNLTHADWTEALEMYKPAVKIVEQIDRAPSANVAQGAEAVSADTCAGWLHRSFGTVSFEPNEAAPALPYGKLPVYLNANAAPPAQTALTDDARDAAFERYAEALLAISRYAKYTPGTAVEMCRIAHKALYKNAAQSASGETK
jgi:hypothetical protein